MHVAVERDLSLFRPDFSVEQYITLLKRYFGFYNPLEQRLRAPTWSSANQLQELRWKTEWLREDLRYFGLEADRLEALPVCDQLPPVDTVSNRLGCLYVLEGSTIGGQFIVRHLQRQFGLAKDRGATFFHGYGVNTSEMWDRFCALLDQHANPSSDDAVIASALVTFRSLHRWLRPTTVRQ